METAIAALQQEATEEEVKGSGSVMSTFWQICISFYAALPVDEIIGIKERPRGQKKEQEHKTLARWIIDKTNTDHYRAGMLSGWKHPYIDADVMEIVGGRKQLLDQANILENETNAGKMGKFKPDWKDVKQVFRKLIMMLRLFRNCVKGNKSKIQGKGSFVSLPVWKMAEKRTGLCMVVLLL